MTLKTALVAPIPIAREKMAVSVKYGRLRNSRTKKRRSEDRGPIGYSLRVCIVG